MSSLERSDPKRHKEVITEISRRMLSGWRMTDRICPLCSTVLVSDKASNKYYCCGCQMWAVEEKRSGLDKQDQRVQEPRAGDAQMSAISSAPLRTKPTEPARTYAKVDESFMEEMEDAEAGEIAKRDQSRKFLEGLSEKLKSDLVAVTEKNIKEAGSDQFIAEGGGRDAEDENAVVEEKNSKNQIARGHVLSRSLAYDENANANDSDDGDDDDDNVSARFANIRNKFIQDVLTQMQDNNPTENSSRSNFNANEIAKRVQEEQDRETREAEEFLAREARAASAARETKEEKANNGFDQENEDDVDLSKFFDVQYLKQDGQVVKESDMNAEQLRKYKESLEQRLDEQKRLDLMGEAVISGATMLASHCIDCGVPQVQLRGTKHATCVACNELGAPKSKTAATNFVSSTNQQMLQSQMTTSRRGDVSAITRQTSSTLDEASSDNDEEEEEEESNTHISESRSRLASMRQQLKDLLDAEKRSAMDESATASDEYEELDVYGTNVDDEYDRRSDASLTMSETRRLLESDELKKELNDRERKRGQLTSVLTTHTMMADYCPDCLIPLVKPRPETVVKQIRESWKEASDDEKSRYFDFTDYESIVQEDFENECSCASCGAKWWIQATSETQYSLKPKAPPRSSSSAVEAGAGGKSTSITKTEKASGESVQQAKLGSSVGSAVPTLTSMSDLLKSQTSSSSSSQGDFIASEEQESHHLKAKPLNSRSGLFDPLTYSEDRSYGVGETSSADRLSTDENSTIPSKAKIYTQSSYVHTQTEDPTHLRTKLALPSALPLSSSAASPSSSRKVSMETMQSVNASMDVLRMSLDCVTQRLAYVATRESSLTSEAMLSRSPSIPAGNGMDQIVNLADKTSQILRHLTEALRIQSMLKE